MPLIRPLDGGVLVLAAAFISVSALFAYGGRGASLELTISGADNQRWRFPLSADETIVVAGPLGDTVVKLSAGAARIVDSPCENKICIAAGALSREGRFSACLPNHVIVTVAGSSEDGETDAVAW